MRLPVGFIPSRALEAIGGYRDSVEIDVDFLWWGPLVSTVERGGSIALAPFGSLYERRSL